jgi:large subunit ribosomal protein L28
VPRSIFVVTVEVSHATRLLFHGKKTSFGNQKTHRGKAKYLGGVGHQDHRHHQPQVPAQHPDGAGGDRRQIVRVKVSAKAIRNGLVTKPVKRRYTKPAETSTGA